MHQANGKQIRKSNTRAANEVCSHKNANMNTRAELNGKSNSVVVAVIIDRRTHKQTKNKREIDAFRSFEVIW